MMFNPIIFLVCTLGVPCLAFWYDCEDGIDYYCTTTEDAVTVCEECEDRGGLCNMTNDPLLCSENLKEGANCSWSNYPCDTERKFSYGCDNGKCWSQCVDQEYGDDEWCWLAKRQPGPRVVLTCTQDSDCQLDKFDSVQCKGKCGTTFKK